MTSEHALGDPSVPDLIRALSDAHARQLVTALAAAFALGVLVGVLFVVVVL